MYIEEKAYNARDYVKEMSQSQIRNCGRIIEHKETLNFANQAFTITQQSKAMNSVMAGKLKRTQSIVPHKQYSNITKPLPASGVTNKKT